MADKARVFFGNENTNFTNTGNTFLDDNIENTNKGFLQIREIPLKIQDEVPIIGILFVKETTGYLFIQKKHPNYFPVDMFLKKPIPPTVPVQKV